MKTSTPIPQPTAPKRHPNQRGDRTRRKFRTFVAADAFDQIEKWEGFPDVLSRGDVIDKLVAHALRTKFDPSKPITRTRTYDE